jgi:hypothetical protein
VPISPRPDLPASTSDRSSASSDTGQHPREIGQLGWIVHRLFVKVQQDFGAQHGTTIDSSGNQSHSSRNSNFSSSVSTTAKSLAAYMRTRTVNFFTSFAASLAGEATKEFPFERSPP